MKRRDATALLGLLGATALGGSALLGACTSPPLQPDLDFGAPPIVREFRGAWVASVDHIDWPSRRGLTTAEQRTEMLTLLDRARQIGLNAIVLQVRPSADALYPSRLEPWSEYLTGASGQPPDPPWDPLAEWVAASHARGLELHAWFNPFRARHPSAQSPPAPEHVANRDPAIVKTYGELLWLDPGEPRAAQRMLDVVLDVVRRYDIDGVHIDDYFYPYPLPEPGPPPGNDQPFPDDISFAAYRDAGGTLARDDWRRDNVNRLIQRLHREIHLAKPWLRFGISPFGLPRPDLRPPGISGFSQFDKLFADVERWLHEGWLDYLAPQLYWPIAQTAQAFPVLLDAWRRENRQARHLWPGLFTSRIGAAERAYRPDEVLAQIGELQQRADVGGHIHFSMAALLQNREGIADRLRDGPYAAAALPPTTPWLVDTPPAAPRCRVVNSPTGREQLEVTAADGPALRQMAVRVECQGRWQLQLHALSPTTGPHRLDIAPEADRLVLNGIGRSARASPPQAWQRQNGRWQRLPPPAAHSARLWSGTMLSLAGPAGSA